MAQASGVIRPNDTSPLMCGQNSDAVVITGGTIADTTNSIGGVAITPVAAEFNTLTDLPASVTTSTTPASGTCAVQFVFKNSAGTALSHALTGLLYFSNSTGLSVANVTSAAVLTNGAQVELKVGYVDLFVTTAAGLFGTTVTASAGTYYITFMLPNGKLLTSSAIVVN